jgi:hypothetical protein
MRRGALLFALMVGLVAARPVSAQFAIAPQVAWGSDTDLAVGGRVIAGLTGTPVLRIEGLVSFDWFLDCENCNYFEVTPAVALGLSVIGLGAYGAAGLNVARISGDSGSNIESNTDLGFALMIGVRTPFGIFGELRNTAGGADQRVITVGFRLGG